MNQEERVVLENEWKVLGEKIKGDFVDPKDVRRMDEITSLLMTNGESSKVKFKFIKGRGGKKGLYTKKGYYDKGPVGL